MHFFKLFVFMAFLSFSVSIPSAKAMNTTLCQCVCSGVTDNNGTLISSNIANGVTLVACTLYIANAYLPKIWSIIKFTGEKIIKESKKCYSSNTPDEVHDFINKLTLRPLLMHNKQIHIQDKLIEITDHFKDFINKNKKTDAFCYFKSIYESPLIRNLEKKKRDENDIELIDVSSSSHEVKLEFFSKKSDVVHDRVVGYAFGLTPRVKLTLKMIEQSILEEDEKPSLDRYEDESLVTEKIIVEEINRHFQSIFNNVDTVDDFTDFLNQLYISGHAKIQRTTDINGTHDRIRLGNLFDQDKKKFFDPILQINIDFIRVPDGPKRKSSQKEETDTMPHDAFIENKIANFDTTIMNLKSTKTVNTDDIKDNQEIIEKSIRITTSGNKINNNGDVDENDHN